MRSPDRPRRAIGLVLIAASLGVAAGCRGAGAPAGSVPASIEAIGHHAENAYDMAKLGDWAKAQASAESLRPALGASASAAGNGASRDDVTTAFGELNRAISRKDQVTALHASNRLTRLGALLSAPYQPQVPPEVTLLDYYGRELEIWAAAGDLAKLRETASALRRTWDAIRPRVEARGGSAEAAHFETLVAQVDVAATPADYARLATPVLDAVDTLEQVFTR